MARNILENCIHTLDTQYTRMYDVYTVFVCLCMGCMYSEQMIAQWNVLVGYKQCCDNKNIRENIKTEAILNFDFFARFNFDFNVWCLLFCFFRRKMKYVIDTYSCCSHNFTLYSECMRSKYTRITEWTRRPKRLLIMGIKWLAATTENEIFKIYFDVPYLLWYIKSYCSMFSFRYITLRRSA